MTTPEERAEEAEAKVERQRDLLRSSEEQVRRLRAEVTSLLTSLADLRDRQPVKPVRGDIYRAWHGTDDSWAGCADSASIERVLTMFPGRTEAEVKAEAWDEAARSFAWANTIGPAPLNYVLKHNPYQEETY